MKTRLSLASIVIAVTACLVLAADQAKESPPQPEPIELSGRLVRPVKWTPQLELMPAGQIKRFDIQGKLLEAHKEGTFLRVRGVVRSRLHTGGTDKNPSPFLAQWMIWLEVTEAEALQDPLDVLKKERPKRTDSN